MALQGRAAKKLEGQLHDLFEHYPQCEVREDQYQATVRHTLPDFSILTLELQLQPEFKAFLKEVQQPASGAVLQPEQLRHSWLGERGEIDHRAYEQKLGGPVRWRRNDDLRRVVRTILDEFVRSPPAAPAVGTSGPLMQAPPPTYSEAYSQAPRATYGQAPPAYTALQPPQQPPPAVQPLAVPTMPPTSLPASNVVQPSTASMSASANVPSGMAGVSAPPMLAPATHVDLPPAPVQLAEPPVGLGTRPSMNGTSGSTGSSAFEPLYPRSSPAIDAVPSSSTPIVDVIPRAGNNGEEAAALPVPTLSPTTAPHAGFGLSGHVNASYSASPAAATVNATAGIGTRANLERSRSVEECDAALQDIKAANVAAARANMARREELATAQRGVEELRAEVARVEQERQRLIGEYERIMTARSADAIRAALKRGVEAADARSAELEPSMDGRAQIDNYLQARKVYHRRAALLQAVEMGQLPPSTHAVRPAGAVATDAFPPVYRGPNA